MEILKSVFLGVLQGLTEFLPVSSDGHLSVLTRLMDFQSENKLFFFVFLHLATMIATIVVFWKEIIALIISLKHIPSSIKNKKWNPDLRMIFLIIIATIPAGLIGFLFSDLVENFQSNMKLVGILFLVNGVFLIATRWKREGKLKENDFGFSSSFLVGLLQGIAVLPAISRSGLTISGTLFMNGEREFAGRFSFLMSLPIILGANIFEFYKIGKKASLYFSNELLPSLVGFLAALITGFLALKLLLNIIKRGRFYYFAYYCFLIGVVTLLFL